MPKLEMMSAVATKIIRRRVVLSGESVGSGNFCRLRSILESFSKMSKEYCRLQEIARHFNLFRAKTQAMNRQIMDTCELIYIGLLVAQEEKQRATILVARILVVVEYFLVFMLSLYCVAYCV